MNTSIKTRPADHERLQGPKTMLNMSGQIIQSKRFRTLPEPLTLTESLGQRLLGPVAPQDRARARLHLLDWAACVWGGRRSAVAEVAWAAEPDSLTRYALLGNVLEMDDVHRQALLHAGPVVWPAALSAARDCAASLGSVLDAGVRGYEAMITLGKSFDAHHYAHFHNSSTAGGFGAVAAAGSVFGFDAQKYVAAFGSAGSLAAGLWHMRHTPEAMTKQLHIAQAVRSGLWFARLADKGLTGPAAILEGPQGLFAAMTRAPKLDAFAQKSGWHMHDTSFKPWAACRHAHAAIDAALLLKERLGQLDGQINVTSYADALRFCDKPAPQSPIEAKFSLQHAVAVVAVRGRPQLADFELEAICDPQLAAVRTRVHVRADADFTARYPAHFGAAVAMGDHHVQVSDAWGDPENPMDAKQITDKAQQLMAWGGADAACAEALIALCLQADESVSATDMLDYLP
jgi:2-methylcitrate dehydratase PrpD